YAHNATHLLIDSTDIGKYHAFSLIGSDVNYDRRSDVGLLGRDSESTKVLANSSIYFYGGDEIAVDEDIIYDINGTKVFLPGGKARLFGVFVEQSSDGAISQPIGVFYYANKQYNIPLRYIFGKNKRDYGSGLESGIYFIPRVVSRGDSVDIEVTGAAIYLPGRVANSLYARLYLYGEENQYFKLVHAEDNAVVEEIKKQSPGFEKEMVYFENVDGPIKIWEIKYPRDIKFKPEFLERKYPEELQKTR
ncbi:MAG: hypothetical protein AABX73_02200, partial [Nanoarchaeota archaeon]